MFAVRRHYAHVQFHIPNYVGGNCGRAKRTATGTDADRDCDLEHFQKEARVNFATACIDVAREVARKHLTIYAVVRTQSATTKEDGYEIEVIYHPELAKEHTETSGAYHHHHNHLVLTFAAAQFAAGKKQLALALVRRLVEAQPEMWWSSPTHPPLTLKKILAGLEKDDESVRQFLKETEDWTYRVKTYGP